MLNCVTSKLIEYATRIGINDASPFEVKTFIEDIMRSCVVFTHSALETALRDIFARRLKAKAETEAPKVPLKGMKRDEKFTWENLYKHRDKTVKQLIDESIDEYASRLSFNSTTEIANHLKEIGVNTKYVTPLFSDLEAMIARRHQIVHEADFMRMAGEKKLEILTHLTVLRWTSNATQFLIYCVNAIIISDSFLKEINQKRTNAGYPKLVASEEMIKELFDLTPRKEE